MRTYQLYLIVDEFASHYFGRENMFFQLFKEYHESSDEMEVILSKQIEYITKPIPQIMIHKVLRQQLKKKKDFQFVNGVYYIENGKISSARLEVFEKEIVIRAKGTFDAETFYFEVLRKQEGAFLAIDLENERYGWLKPIKERTLV